MNHLEAAIEETGFNPLAFACVISGNVREILRESLEQKQNAYIVEAWDSLIDDKKALAVLRATLSTVSKKLYGFGLTVENHKLVQAKTRAKKSKPENLLLKMAKEFSKEMDQEKQDKIIALMVELSR
jgi:hypothetical protein